MTAGAEGMVREGKIGDMIIIVDQKQKTHFDREDVKQARKQYLWTATMISERFLWGPAIMHDHGRMPAQNQRGNGEKAVTTVLVLR